MIDPKICIIKELEKILHGLSIPDYKKIMFCLEVKLYHNPNERENDLICKIFHRAKTNCPD